MTKSWIHKIKPGYILGLFSLIAAFFAAPIWARHLIFAGFFICWQGMYDDLEKDKNL